MKKEIKPNRLLTIRMEKGYTQEEMGEFLGVSATMISYYETGKHNLPTDKAEKICEKWNYNINWFYTQETTDNKETTNNNQLIFYPEYENTTFLVDIRDFISIEYDKENNTSFICFSLPNYYWEYIKYVNQINTSSKTEKEKTRAIAELNSLYKKTKENSKKNNKKNSEKNSKKNSKDDDNNNIYWEAKYNINDFISTLHFGDKSLTYATSEENDMPQISKEQINDAKEFLNFLTQST